MTNKQLTIKPSIHGKGFVLATPDDKIAVSVSTNQVGYEVDPEKLLEWLETQRPTLRWRVRHLPGRITTSIVYDADSQPGEIGRATFYGDSHATDAEEYAALLNEREAAK